MVLLAGLSACSAAGWVDDADAEVADVLADGHDRALADREQWIVQPDPRPEPEADDVPGDPAATAEPAPAPVDSLRIDMDRALEAAFETAREYLTRREQLYVSGLGLTGTRFAFGPQLNASIDAIWGNSEGGPSTTDYRGNLGLSQILPSGGSFSIATSLGTSRVSGPFGELDDDDGRSWDSSVGFSLNQPLARGFGRRVAWEALTQAERTLLYDIRDFELFRQDLVIGILSDYFDLIRLRTQLGNVQRNYDNAVFDRNKAEALRQVDRATDEDLFLARRRVIDTETQLIAARTNLQFAKDAFRIRLGLPEAEEVIIGDEEPPFEAVRLDVESAVTAAMNNRLDLITARERVEDSHRQLAITRNGLLPDVDLGLDYGLSGQSGIFGESSPDRWDRQASLSIEIPLQRVPERNSYRRALITYDQAVRGLELTLENVERDIRNSLRELDRLEQSIDLQGAQITQDERAVEVTRIRYESGEADNRDLLDARQSLTNAQDALIQARVDHFIARLQLYRDLGLLFVDEKGRWRT